MNDISLGGQDLALFNSHLYKARNVLKTQIGSLEYEREFGIDLKFFLDDQIVFQNENLKAHIIERLSFYGILVTQLGEARRSFDSLFEIRIDESRINEGFMEI